MVDRFPNIPQTVDPAETHFNHSFDHLIACVNEGELYCAHGLAIDSNNSQIYVAEGIYLFEGYSDNIARVSIFSETGDLLNTFSHPHMKWPWGIAIHRDNVYVTDRVEHSVFHFKVGVDFTLVARQGNIGSGIGQFDEPRQLAVSTNGEIFVTESNNNRVQILDSKLHYQRHISHHSMALPIDVKLTPDEVFVVCQASPSVKVFSYTGDLIRSIILRGDIGMQGINPAFFCLDSDCNLLLSDRLDHQIKIFSKDGTLLHTLGEEGHGVGMFFIPHGIALTKDRKLVIVSGNLYYSLQIYSSD